MDEKKMEEEVTKRVADIKKEMDKHQVVVTVIKPDGTKTTTSTTDTHATSETVRTEVKYVDRIVERVVTQTVDRVVETKVLVEPELKRWRVGLLAGVRPSLIPPDIQPIALGAEGEMRIAKTPLWVGVWGLSNINTAPIPSFQGVQVGVKIGVEF